MVETASKPNRTTVRINRTARIAVDRTSAGRRPGVGQALDRPRIGKAQRAKGQCTQPWRAGRAPWVYSRRAMTLHAADSFQWRTRLVMLTDSRVHLESTDSISDGLDALLAKGCGSGCRRRRPQRAGCRVSRPHAGSVSKTATRPRIGKYAKDARANGLPR